MRSADRWIIGITVFGLAVGITFCARLTFKSKPVVVAQPSPPPAIPPEPEVPAVVYSEPEEAPKPCTDLSDSASLACVLRSPLDLDGFSDATLSRAERAALKDRLSLEVSTPLG